MNHTEPYLKRITHKIQQLVKLYHAVQKENNRLKAELDATKEKVMVQEKIIDELNQQIGILKISGAAMTDTDKKEFEKRINAYLKEIDRCIALLGE